MAVSPREDSLDILIQKICNPLRDSYDPALVYSFCEQVKIEEDGPLMATRLLAYRVQSPQEKEAMLALDLLETCARTGGPAFQAEVGKFRFLNELIKLLSPRYLAARTPLRVKQRTAQLLVHWSRSMSGEGKIVEAVQLLQSQGLLQQYGVSTCCRAAPAGHAPAQHELNARRTDDTGATQEQWHTAELTHAQKTASCPVPSPEVDADRPETPPDQCSSMPSSERLTNPIFEDAQKAAQLKRLLQSTVPEDIQAANRLIKSMVKQDEERVEQDSRRVTELETVRSNVRLLEEMLDNYSPDTTSQEELDLMGELRTACQQKRPRLDRLASETDDREAVLSELVEAVERIEAVVGRHDQLTRQGAAAGGTPLTLLHLEPAPPPAPSSTGAAGAQLLHSQLESLGILDGPSCGASQSTASSSHTSGLTDLLSLVNSAPPPPYSACAPAPSVAALPTGLAAPTTLPTGLAAPTTLPTGLTAPTTLPTGLAASTTLPTGLAAPTTLPTAVSAPTTLPTAVAAPGTLLSSGRLLSSSSTGPSAMSAINLCSGSQLSSTHTHVAPAYSMSSVPPPANFNGILQPDTAHNVTAAAASRPPARPGAAAASVRSPFDDLDHLVRASMSATAVVAPMPDSSRTVQTSANQTHVAETTAYQTALAKEDAMLASLMGNPVPSSQVTASSSQDNAVESQVSLLDLTPDQTPTQSSNAPVGVLSTDATPAASVSGVPSDDVGMLSQLMSGPSGSPDSLLCEGESAEHAGKLVNISSSEDTNIVTIRGDGEPTSKPQKPPSLADFNILLQDIIPDAAAPAALFADQSTLEVRLHRAANRLHADVTAYVITTLNRTSQPVCEYSLQAAADRKGARVRLLPPSSRDLPAGSPFLPPPAASQILLLASTPAQQPGGAVTLRFVLSYNSQGETITEMCDIRAP